MSPAFMKIHPCEFYNLLLLYVNEDKLSKVPLDILLVLMSSSVSLSCLSPQADGEDELKKRQLMELAIINGTYRDSSSKNPGRLNLPISFFVETYINITLYTSLLIPLLQ